MRFARTVLSTNLATVALAAGCQTIDGDLPTRRSQPPQPATAEVSGTPAAAPPSLVQCSAKEPEQAARPATECVAQVIPLMTLDEALRTAETRQPQLVVAAAAVDAARGRYRQAQVYPNPTAEFLAQGVTGLAGQREYFAGASQPVIIGPRRQRAIQAGNSDIDARELEFHAVRARVFFQVKQAFYEVLALQQLVTLAREQERNAAALVKTMEARFKKGDVAERDVLRVEVDLANVRIQAENLERDLTEARKTLATRMGVSTAVIARCAGELPQLPPFASEEELIRQLVQVHPELQAALAEVRFRLAAIDQEKAERVPDATVTVLYDRFTEPSRDTVDLGIRLPLPLFDRRQGHIAEAEAEALRAQARHAQTENDLIGQLRRAYESLLTYYRQVEAYRTNILPKTERSLEVVRAAYEGGQVSVLELLDAQRQSNAAHAAYLEVLSRLVQRWAEVEYLVQSQPPAPAP